MALTVSQRLDRLRVRSEELRYWRAREGVTVTGWSIDGAPIEIPERGSVTFATDGQISALGAGDNPRDIQLLAQLKLVNPPKDQLVRGDDGLFRTTSGDPMPNDANARMLSGALEGSNVNPVEAMVGMIAASRQFEQQMRLLQTAETNDKTASQLLSMNG